MRQYIYTPEEAQFNCWPSGELRLEGIDITRNPEEADVFVTPGNLSMFRDNGRLRRDWLERLPYYRGREERHVFFDVSDNFTEPNYLPILFIRCDVRTWMLEHDTGSLSVAWPVEDYEECVDLPAGGFAWDVSGRMWISTDTRDISTRVCLDHSGLRPDIVRYDDFTGYIYHEPEGVRRRKFYRQSMKGSRVCLCPESIPGVLPYRFFEAMSAGRVPVLVSSDYVLPFADLIPYDSFIVRIERGQASETANIIKDFLAKHPDEELVRMGLAAREFWLRFLDSRRWPETMGFLVRKAIERRQEAAIHGGQQL